MTSIPTPAEIEPGNIDPIIALDVQQHRRAIADIVQGRDDRLLAIVGPCSVHDAQALHEYVARLRQVAIEHEHELLVVVRVYLEKPRTRHGWPGFLLDPQRDGSASVLEGLPQARQMLATVASCNMPIACEFVDPLLAPYISDYVSWAAIGARTVESPIHRRLASDLDMPVGMKNRTDGAIGPAVDAVAVAGRSQPMVNMHGDGRLYSYQSSGNSAAHLVLRGGDHGPNYESSTVEEALSDVQEIVPKPRLVVDCSHGNSAKDHRRQRLVVDDICAQLDDGQTGIAGIMLESFLHEGRQSNEEPLSYGVSVTDSCIDMGDTAELMSQLAKSVTNRRHRRDSLVGNVPQ